MKATKLNLQDLKVQSFITEIGKKEETTIQGGDVGSLTCGGPDCPPIFTYDYNYCVSQTQSPYKLVNTHYVFTTRFGA
jgi:hypothetical protein